ncbi:MAG: hypothetical protein MR355_09835 [Lachnospiraceae bacterium]|nr:hypothetical protein [Lachnospiraceae bacterium]
MRGYESFYAVPSAMVVAGVMNPAQGGTREQYQQKQKKQESDEFDKLFQQACKLYA